MSVEIIIILYIYLCACMVLFNAAYLIYNRRTLNFIDKRSQMLRRMILQQFLFIETNQPIDEKLQKKIYKKLNHLNSLIAFSEAYSIIKEEKDDIALVYFDASRHYFEKLAIHYAKRPNEEKAYFSYLMSIYETSIVSDDDLIGESMISYMNNKSAYVRENAMKSLYQMGNQNLVIRALRVLNLTEDHQNVKLLSDGLASFKGDHEALMSLAWKNFERFTPSIQVSIINYIRMQSADYCDSFSYLLEQANVDKEVKFAILRYYRKYHYEPITAKLIHLLLETDDNLWEYAAISASTLENYPSDVTDKALRLALKSSNWYVRFNAADSLIHLGLTQESYLEDPENNDKYAKEMFIYRWENHENKLAK